MMNMNIRGAIAAMLMAGAAASSDNCTIGTVSDVCVDLDSCPGNTTDANGVCPYWSLSCPGDTACYEQQYMDDDMEPQGWVNKPCDAKFNTLLSRRVETLCKGHSKTNIKWCTTGTVQVPVLKLGIASPSTPLYHLTSSQESNCYQTTYNDDHYTQDGWKAGGCDAKFNVVVDSTATDVCDGQSETNIKDCPTQVVTIVIEKLGVQ